MADKKLEELKKQIEEKKPQKPHTVTSIEMMNMRSQLQVEDVTKDRAEFQQKNIRIRTHSQSSYDANENTIAVYSLPKRRCTIVQASQVSRSQSSETYGVGSLAEKPTDPKTIISLGQFQSKEKTGVVPSFGLYGPSKDTVGTGPKKETTTEPKGTNEIGLADHKSSQLKKKGKRLPKEYTEFCFDFVRPTIVTSETIEANKKTKIQQNSIENVTKCEPAASVLNVRNTSETTGSVLNVCNTSEKAASELNASKSDNSQSTETVSVDDDDNYGAVFQPGPPRIFTQMEKDYISQFLRTCPSDIKATIMDRMSQIESKEIEYPLNFDELHPKALMYALTTAYSFVTFRFDPKYLLPH